MADDIKLRSGQFKNSSQIKKLVRNNSDYASISESDIIHYRELADEILKKQKQLLDAQKKVKDAIASGKEEAQEALDILSDQSNEYLRHIEYLEEVDRQHSEIAEKDEALKRTTAERIDDAKRENALWTDYYNYKTRELDAENKIIRAKKVSYDLEQSNHASEKRNLQLKLDYQKAILVSETSSAKMREDAAKEILKIQKDIDNLDKKHASYENAGGMLFKATQLAENKDSFTPFNAIQQLFSDAKSAFSEGKKGGLTPVGALLNIKDILLSGNEEQKKNTEAITKALASGFNAMNAIIDNAIGIIQTGYGSVTAALDGTGQTFDDIRKNLTSGAGISALVKQSDLLKEVTSIAKDGISTDIESIAILSTIRDKTVASFNATDGNLRRLVRLNQNLGNLTAKQFGLAAVLRTELNSAFGDSSFIGRQFQTLTGTILDAMSMNSLKGGTDSTNYYAILETFAGGLYEAGVDEGTVSAIAQGINYLGSGNINALSGNKTLQNLLLLSMDRVGMDYATVLQQGLTTDETYLLLQSIIDYLAEITEQNKENNVLQSSYANLFNLSVTDMTAIRNLSKNSIFRNYAASSVNQNNSFAMQAALNEINAVSERTMFSEKMNNVFDNAKFIMGAGVASSPVALATNLISRYGIQAGHALEDAGLTKIGKATTLASGVAWGLSLLGGLDDLLSGVKASFNTIGTDNNTLSNYFTTDFSENGGWYDMAGGGRDFSKQGKGLKTFDIYSDTYGSDYNTSQTKFKEESDMWEQEQKAAEEDPNTKILKEFEKTLMKAKDSDNYAFAVSLQGMSDGVLRSFASIFADEDAMMETLTGQNNSLEQNNTFIDYATDTSTAVSSNGSTSTSNSAK